MNNAVLLEHALLTSILADDEEASLQAIELAVCLARGLTRKQIRQAKSKVSKALEAMRNEVGSDEH